MARTPQALFDILNGSTAAASLVAQIREQSALLALVKRELEESVNAHLLATLMHDKQLILYADSPAWASRLRFGSRTLRGRLVSRGMEIRKITVRVFLQSGRRRGGPHTERHLSRANADVIETTAETIDDPGLRRALKRLSRHGR